MMDAGRAPTDEVVAAVAEIPRLRIIEAGSGGEASGAVPQAEETRPQADPLPQKRGEIGFQERYLQQLAADEDDDDGTQNSAPAARHPADRDAPPSVSTQPPESSNAAGASRPDTPTILASSNKRFASKQLPSLGGVHLSTLLLLLVQCTLICATLVGWILFGIFSSKSNSNSNNNSNSSLFGASSAQIFGHVLFTIALLVQLVFLERRIYYLRAERYVYANPGLPPPGARGHEHDGRGVGFAPWNRPPLPTYAAALAQSGVGTGDVEDNAIAIPPPPAYGHTRGSTLLLSGLLSDTLRAQRRERGGSGAGASVRLSGMSSRPVSYASHDGEWEQRRDGMRALALESTLAKLEDARVSTQDGELRRGGTSRA